MDSVQHHTHLASPSFPSFNSHSTNSTPSYPVYHNSSTNNVPYMQQQQQQPSPRLQHSVTASTNMYHSPSLHHQQQPMHTAPAHYSPKFNSGTAMPHTHFSLDETSNNNTSSIPNSPQISPSVRSSQISNAALRSPKFKSSPLLSPSTGPLEEKGDERQRCCVVCLRNSPKTIFSCRYKVHDKNVDVLNRYFDRELRFGELCDRCYRLWYKFKRNAGSTNNTPSFSPMIPPTGTPPFSPLTSPASPKAMRQNGSHKNLSLSPLVLQQATHNGANNIGNSPLSLVPSSPASSSSKPYPTLMMPPPFSLAGSAELSRDEKDIVHQVVNQHYQHYSPSKKYYMDGMEHYISQPIAFEKVVPSAEDNNTSDVRFVQQPNHTTVIEEEEEMASSSASSTQDDMETSSNSSDSSSRTTSPKPRSFMNQLMELSKPPRISKRKPTAIRSVAKVDPVTEFVKFGHYTSTHSTSSIPLQKLYKNVVRTFNV